MRSAPLVHLVCGSTGAGKTTYAVALANRLGAARFLIDEWMTALFWMESPEPIQFDWTLERVARCEAQIWATAAQVADLFMPAILDLGLSKRIIAANFYALSRTGGFDVQLHFVDTLPQER